jgi:hypothetical protein
MKTRGLKRMTMALATGLALMTMAGELKADTFGSGANTFTIDFVTVGDPGNPDDTGTTGIHFRIPPSMPGNDEGFFTAFRMTVSGWFF